MGKSFLTKPKPKQDGSYWGCKKCQKVPTANQDIYMQNIGDDINKNWIACTDLECFISQGGNKPEANYSGGYKKAKTPEETFSWRKALSDKAWDEAWNKSKDVALDGALDSVIRAQKRIDIAIAIYRGIMG